MPDLPSGAVTTSLTSPRAPNWQIGYSFYGPGVPQTPILPNQPTRQFDYPVAVNTVYTPRHTEAFTFQHLRAFANVELVRMAIETRKDQLERLDWMVKPRDNKKSRAAKERDPRCAEVERFLQRPNGVDYFAEFFRAIDEDLLALDAPCIERVRTRGGKIHGLEYVDGSTINLLVDETGRRPRNPDGIAFQQIVHGVVLKDLANKDLIYIPRNVRSGHIYGFSPVEQMIVTINTIIRRQASQLAYFAEGNVPAGIINGPEDWQTDQLREMQSWFDDAIGGNAGQQRSIKWVPFGAKYQPFKDSPLKDDFDEWLARKVSFAFSLPPTPFIRQMNKGTAGEDQERSLEEGLEPLKQWRKRIIDRLIDEEFGYTDLEFSFQVSREIDPKIQSEVDDKALRNGSATIDEIRDTRGQDPLPNELGSKPLIYTTTGVVTLESALNPVDPDPMLEPPAPVHVGDEPDPPESAQAQNDADEQGKKPAQDKKKVHEHGHLTKAKRKAFTDDALALSVDRPAAIEAAQKLHDGIVKVFAKGARQVGAEVASHFEKAERDPIIEAAKIAAALDLSFLLDLEDDLDEQLETIGLDAVGAAAVSISVGDVSNLVNRVNPRAVAYAKDRAAELVSLNGDESLVASTRNMLRSVIADGLSENIGRDAIAENIASSAAFSDSRATLIANTEIANANAAGKAAAWGEVRADGEVLVKEWFISADEGVCAVCEMNDAQGEIPFDDAFDSGDDMEPAHPGCLTGDSRVLAIGVSAASQRWYDGDVIVIRTASGENLTCTPNHPILTQAGWVAAGELNEGDHVVSCRLGDRDSLGRLDNQDVPARIEDVAKALRRSEQVTATPVPVTAEDFHGDGEGSEVAVVFADRELWRRRNSASGEHGSKLDLTLVDVGLTDHPCSGVLHSLLKSSGSASRGDMSGRELAVALLDGHSRPLEPLSIRLAAPNNCVVSQHARDDGSLKSESLGDGVLALTSEVSSNDRRIVSGDAPLSCSFDTAASKQALHLNGGKSDLSTKDRGTLTSLIALSQIVDVKRQRFSGHVYNLQTEDGYYVAEGIVTHNCRCVVTARVPAPGETE